MKRRFFEAVKEEKGMALPIVLVLLLLGGLIIAPTLSYASTSLKVGRIVEENVNGLYAADAGIEDTLWKIKNGAPISSPDTLPENVNQMAVSIDTLNKGDYALYNGELVEVGGKHYDYLDVEGEILWNEPAGAYQYKITVTWQAEQGDPPIKLADIGVRLPVGYSYQLGSAFIFSATNLSPNDPDDDTLDWAGAHMLNWGFPSPRPEVTEGNPATQTFYITGEGGLEGHYTWVVAAEADIGIVSEVTGTLYRITATATRPGDVDPTATIEADVMLYEGTGEITILLWQINPEEGS